MDGRLDSGTRLHTRHYGGDGPTSLFLHGWATTGDLWRPVLRDWPLGAGTAIAVDLRGAGASAKPPHGYRLADFAGDIVALLRTFDDPVRLVGHSLGGTIAQLVALEEPARVARLVLVSPVPAGGVTLPERDIAYLRSLAGTEAGMRTVIRSMMAAPPPDPIVERLVASAATVLPEAYLGGFEAWRTADFADRLAELRVPTVVMGGELEQPLSPDVLKTAVADRIAGAVFQEIPGVGHYPQVEATEVFRAMLLAALTP